MSFSQTNAYFSPKDYLEIEKTNPIKHEYRQGLIYAMAGASKAHVIITLNLASLLRNHVRNTSCLTYIADTKVRIETADVFYYPDVTVTCDERDRTSEEDFIRYPRLIVEVLSPKTEAFDRGDKFEDYKILETLEEYFLISQNEMKVECYRRNQEGNWVLYTYREGEEVRLASVDFNCAIAALYEKVSLLV